MLEKGSIENSNSPFNATVWVVPMKKESSGKQKLRTVIDFRILTERTEQDAYTLPNTDKILQHIGNEKFFSVSDLSSRFQQIPMSTGNSKYIAFSTTHGHFQFNQMPFGLKNTPAKFQRMMDTALR